MNRGHASYLLFLAFIALWAAPGGCSSYVPPMLAVTSVAITEKTDAGIVLEFTLNAENVNSVALPLREMRYRVSLDGREVFRGYRSPEATLRRYGVQQLKLPAVIALGPGQPPPSGEVKYSLDGTLTYLIPGELAEILFENDVRRPTVTFSEKGTFDLSEPAAPAPPASTPTP